MSMFDALPTFRSIIIAIVFVFLGTSRGRAAASVATNKALRKGIHKIPMRYRLFVLGKMFSLPYPSITRRLMKFATQPVGEENSHFVFFRKDKFAATWIVPNIKRKKNPVEWIEQFEAPQADAVILYFHGGGFRQGHSVQYMPSFLHIIDRLQHKYGLRSLILSVECSLSPETVWPTARDECVQAYQYLVHAIGIAPSKIIVAGDSAGGWLTAETILTVRNQRKHKELADLPPIPLPAGCIMISPWITMEMDSPTYKTNRETDYLQPESLSAYINDFLPQLSVMKETERATYLRQPYISPIYADYEGFCPTLVAIGGGEIFKHDLEILVDRLKTASVQVDVLTRDKAPHVWVMDPALNFTREDWLQDISQIADWCAKTIQQK